MNEKYNGMHYSLLYPQVDQIRRKMKADSHHQLQAFIVIPGNYNAFIFLTQHNLTVFVTSTANIFVLDANTSVYNCCFKKEICDLPVPDL
jgi:hypothetical protein